MRKVRIMACWQELHLLALAELGGPSLPFSLADFLSRRPGAWLQPLPQPGGGASLLRWRPRERESAGAESIRPVPHSSRCCGAAKETTSLFPYKSNNLVEDMRPIYIWGVGKYPIMIVCFVVWSDFKVLYAFREEEDISEPGVIREDFTSGVGSRAWEMSRTWEGREEREGKAVTQGKSLEETWFV